MAAREEVYPIENITVDYLNLFISGQVLDILMWLSRILGSQANDNQTIDAYP